MVLRGRESALTRWLGATLAFSLHRSREAFGFDDGVAVAAEAGLASELLQEARRVSSVGHEAPAGRHQLASVGEVEAEVPGEGACHPECPRACHGEAQGRHRGGAR